MPLPLVLAAAALVVLLAFFVRKARPDASWPFAIAAVFLTPLLAEAALALRPEPRLAPPPVWSPRGLEPVERHRVPADFGAAPSAAPTIVVIGDSFAAGQGVVEAEAFPRVLDRVLGERGHDARVRLIAMPGWNLDEQLLAYDVLAAPLRPDVVVWTFVLNDLGLGRFSDGVRDLVLEPSPERSGSRLLDACRAARHAADVDAASVRMYRDALSADRAEVRAFGEHLRSLAGETRARGGRFVLAIHPLLDHLDDYRFEAEHATVRKLGEAAGAEVVDLLDAFRGRDARALWASPLDHHPNAAGHRLAGLALADALAAGPLSVAGPVECAQLPAPEPADLVRAACAEPSPANTLALAEALVAGPPGGLRSFAAHLAVVATHRAEGDAAVADRAAAVVRATRAGDAAAAAR